MLDFDTYTNLYFCHAGQAMSGQVRVPASQPIVSLVQTEQKVRLRFRHKAGMTKNK